MNNSPLSSRSRLADKRLGIGPLPLLFLLLGCGSFTPLPVAAQNANLSQGLVLNFKLNETTGLSAQDNTTNRHLGALVDYADPSQAWTPGKVGGALQFDGQLNRVMVPSSPSLNPGAEASFSFWIKPASYGTVTSAGSYDIAEGHLLRRGSQYDLYLLDNPGSVRQTLLVNGVNAPQISVALNEWQHFAVVFQIGKVTFYKNGFPLADPVAAALGAPVDANLLLGCNTEDIQTTSRLFQGLMDEVGIWDRPLLEAEVLTLAGKDAAGAPAVDTQSGSLTRLEDGAAEFRVLATGLRPITYQWFRDGQAIPGGTSNRLTLNKLTQADAGPYTVVISNQIGRVTSAPMQLTVEVIRDVKTGLVGYWNFDETSGATYRDSSGRNHDAAIQNAPAASSVAGQIGGAFDLNGNDTFAVVPHHPELVLTDQATIAVWVNPRGYGGGNGYGRILRKGINYDFLLLGTQQGPVFFGINKTAYNGTANSIELDTWQHVVFTFKKGVVQFYKNGQPLGNPLAGQLSAGTTDPLAIGNYQADLAIARVFDGLLDDLGLWNRALSAEEIAGIYGNGLAGKPLNTPQAPIVPFQIQSFVLAAGNKLQIKFTSPNVGKTHAVQKTSSLLNPQWSPVSNAQIQDLGQGNLQATLDRAADAASFYRLVVP